MSIQGGKDRSGNGAKAKAATDAEKQAEWERLQREFSATLGAALNRDNREAALQARFDAALERLRAATPRSAAHTRGFIVTPDDDGLEFDPECAEPMMLPPWVTDTLVRGDVSIMVGDPNVGKSQMISSTAMAIAYAAVTEMLGEAGDGWLGHALFVSNEEKPAYVRARWKVLIDKLPPLKRKERHKLILWKKRLVFGRFEDGVIVPTADVCEFVEWLATNAEKGIRFAYIGLDPLSTLFAGIKENDAVQTGDAVRFLKRIAEAAYAAIEVSHHTSKAARGKEDATASRGSTGTEAASDHMGTLTTLQHDKHKALGFPAEKLNRVLRRKGVRSRGKRAGERYFEREVITVAAEDERHPGVLATGTVAIVTPIPLPAKTGLDADTVQRWLFEANQGKGARQLTRGQRMAGKPGAAVLIVMEKGGCDRRTAEAMIDELLSRDLARLEDEWISKHQRSVVIAEPPRPDAEDDEDETDYQF